jgi:hypothetical protein
LHGALDPQVQAAVEGAVEPCCWLLRQLQLLLLMHLAQAQGVDLWAGQCCGLLWHSGHTRVHTQGRGVCGERPTCQVLSSEHVTPVACRPL